MVRDPYKYFRIEARELLDGLARGTLDLEKGDGDGELVVQMLRLAHTLKGASRVVRQAQIAELAHAVESVLAPHREPNRGAVARADIDRLLALLDQMSGAVTKLDEPAAPASTSEPRETTPPTPSAPDSLRSVRVEIDEMDALLEGLFAVNVKVTAVRRLMADFHRGRDLASTLVERSLPTTGARAAAEELRAWVQGIERNLASLLDQAHDEMGQVRDKASELRLTPAEAIFGMLERGVRDAAQALQKSVTFETRGGDCRLEANVLFALRDALLHVVRNAIAHGIEGTAERRRLGKAEAGRVSVHVERRGNRVAFVCRDDGRGIDVEAVRRAAVARGVTPANGSTSLSRDHVIRFVLESGVSTTDEVTEVSGRGIGLDVVRATAARLKGEVHLESEPGRGTTIDVCVPISVTSIVTLAVEADGLIACLPLDSIHRTGSIAANEIAHSADRDSVVVDGLALPFLPLAVALRRPVARDRPNRPWTVVIVRAGSRSAAIAVDRLVGTSEVVARSLPKLAGPVPLVAGASLDPDGNPQILLDPSGLVDLAYASRVSAPEPAPAKRPAPILIVDDSLTTRMLEQSILESAGYEVDLATSAEQAVTKAREAAYSLFLVDVEMPGMNGFEFVSTTRADPSLREIPAILVTSRDAAQDRRRGMEVGASAYIVKGEFDQGQLLGTIRQLIG